MWKLRQTLWGRRNDGNVFIGFLTEGPLMCNRAWVCQEQRCI